MGRLIDADKFKTYLQEYLGYGHAIPWVDEQPTAYDVEKVVAELENKDDDCGCGKIDVWTAIDIVKRGGVE